MLITSPAFKNNESIPSEHTCDGSDSNPPLEFQDVPLAAESLVLVMEDPDVPKELREDQMWNHWIVFNIPPDTPGVGREQEPPGIHGLGTSDNTDYHGPCPPDGEHRYFFKLYALDTTLDLPEKSSKEAVLQAMEGHVLEQAELVGRYERIS